jgi:hypothetical protein
MQWNDIWLKFVGFVTGIGLVIAPWLNSWIYHQNPQTNPSMVVGNQRSDRNIWPSMWWKYGPNETPPPWQPYGIPVDSRQLGSLQSIPVIPIVGTCPETGRQIQEGTLHEAFVVTNPLDIQNLVINPNMYKTPEEELHATYSSIFKDIPYGRFLVIQLFVRNIGSPDQGTSGLLYTAIQSANDPDYRLPLHFDGGYPLFGWESRPMWYIFPIRNDERVFTIYFCDEKKPVSVKVDFSNSHNQIVRGAFSFTHGLYIP